MGKITRFIRENMIVVLLSLIGLGFILIPFFKEKGYLVLAITLIYGYVFIPKVYKNKSFWIFIILILFVLCILNLWIVTMITLLGITIFNIKKDNKRRILITSYDMGFGGIEKALLCLLKNFNYDNFNVTLLLEKNQGVFLKDIPKEVAIMTYGTSEIKNIIIRKVINLCKRIIFIIMHAGCYDATISYATYSKTGSLCARLSSKNSLLYVHSNYSYVYNEKEFKNFFGGVFVNNFKTIVFVSNESRNDFLRYYPTLEERTLTINNLIDEEDILNKALKEVKITKDNKKHILFVGRLDENSKRISRIIEVSKKLKDNNKNIVFWIIGSGPDEKNYKSEVKKNKLEDYVIFYGAKENPYPYINACDAVILTSEYEGFPVVYNEAIILNKTILTTIDVSDDFISIKNRFGIIMEKNVDDIYDKVTSFCKDGFTVKEKINFSLLNKKRISALETILGGKENG